ncbi:MAG: Hint domain-containing protein [Hydrogenoanaerobacterium sp.]
MDNQFFKLFGGEDLFRDGCPRLYGALTQGANLLTATDDILPASIMANIVSRKPIKVQISHYFSEEQVSLIVRTDIWNNEKNEKLASFFSQAEGCQAHTPTYELEEAVGCPALRVEVHALWLTQEGHCHTGEAVTYSPAVAKQEVDLVANIAIRKPRARDTVCTKIAYLGRSGRTMDYEYNVTPVSGQLRAMLPFEGRITFLENWIPVEIIMDQPLFGPSPSLKLVIENGGTVEYYPERGGKGFFERLRLENNEVAWNLGDDDWHSNIDISRFSAQTIVTLHSVFTVKVQKSDQPEYFQYLVVHVDSHSPINAQNGFRSPINVDIEPIQIFWGCVAKGTRVGMADGAKRAIENLRVGDEVFTDREEIAYISDIIYGREETLLRILTDSGEEILLTKDHPVLTSRGLLKAECINAGDRLITQNGEAGIRYLYPTEYSDEVYNLSLNPPSLIFLNGIVCGDFEHQNSSSSHLPDTPIISDRIGGMLGEMKQLFDRISRQ